MKVYSLQFAVHSVAFFLFTVHCLLYTICYAQTISSTELINNARQYDSKTIVYQGEVVGDVMARREFVWLNLFDGENAVGVWLRKGMLPPIKFIGGYHEKGAILEIEGIFHINCLEHGGDLDIHADKVKIIAQGSKIKEEVSYAKRIWAKNFLLSVLFLLVCIIFRELKNRWKKRLKN